MLLKWLARFNAECCSLQGEVSLWKGQDRLKGFAVQYSGISFIKTQVVYFLQIAWLYKIARSITPNLLSKGKSYAGVSIPSPKMECKVYLSDETVQSWRQYFTGICYADRKKHGSTKRRCPLPYCNVFFSCNWINSCPDLCHLKFYETHKLLFSDRPRTH